MVFFKPLLATTAVLSLSSSAVLAAPTVEWIHPIYRVPIKPGNAKVAAGSPKIINYTANQLSRFGGVSSLPGNPGNATVKARDASSEADSHLHRSRGIIGPDNRVLWPNEEYPYGAIGRVEQSAGLCSGSMIGRRLVATAKHCMPPDGGWARFAPSYYDGERNGGSDVVAIISMDQGEGPCNQKEDWAIFVLADPVGDWTGYLGANVIDCDAQKNQPMFIHQGYPGDHGASRPYRQDSISVSRCADCEPGGPLETDADAVPGQSGGPLWLEEFDGYYVYGVASATSAIGTGFASGSNFVGAIAQARIDFP